jgi:hypothetical protein
VKKKPADFEMICNIASGFRIRKTNYQFLFSGVLPIHFRLLSQKWLSLSNRGIINQKEILYKKIGEALMLVFKTTLE